MLRLVPPIREDEEAPSAIDSEADTSSEITAEAESSQATEQEQPAIQKLDDSDILNAISRIYDEVFAGRITTHRQAMAVLKMQGIVLTPDKPRNYQVDEEFRGLCNLLRYVELGLDPRESEIYDTLSIIDRNPANWGTLKVLNDLEKENRNKPYFPKLQKLIGAIRLLKKKELITYFRRRLRNTMKESDNYAKAILFKEDFFGSEDELGRTPGCGLTPEELGLSPAERMFLNKIKMLQEGEDDI